MKKHIGLLLLFFSQLASAQVHNGGFLLPSQQAVDSIGHYLDSLGIHTLTGGLWIGRTTFGSRSDIHDLSALASLKKIGGLVIDKNGALHDLTGLHHLDTIGGGSFLVRDNDSLLSIAALQNAIFTSLNASLDSHVEIINNPQLLSLDGLEGVSKIGGQLRVQFNPNLANIEGLKSLTFVESLSSFRDFASPTLNGLENFGGPTSLFIANNPFLTDISALQNLDTIASLYLTDLDSLQDISPLENLVLFHLNSSETRNTSSLTLLNCPKIQKIPTIHFGRNMASWVEMLELEQLSDISGLHELQDVTFFTLRNCESLSSFAMPNLQQVGGLEIFDNDSLNNFDFPQLRDTIGGIYINDNLNLQFISEKNTLKKTRVNIEINNNPQLRYIEGFNALTAIEKELQIRDNPQLEKIEGFNNLETGESIWFDNNLLDSIIGFNRLKFVNKGLAWTGNTGKLIYPSFDSLICVEGSIGFYQNTQLKEITGFSNIKNLDVVDIEANDALISIDAFHNLDSLLWKNFGSLHVNENPSLIAFKGFNALRHSAATIHCHSNPLLSDCEAICNIKASLNSPTEFNVFDNDSPCDSEANITRYCDTLHTNVYYPASSNIRLFPNPTSNKITLTFDPSQDFQLAQLIDIQGQILFSQHLKPSLYNCHFDLSALPDGMYFLRLWDAQNQSVQKRIILHRL